jgi:hypothetical protein
LGVSFFVSIYHSVGSLFPKAGLFSPPGASLNVLLSGDSSFRRHVESFLRGHASFSRSVSVVSLSSESGVYSLLRGQPYPTNFGWVGLYSYVCPYWSMMLRATPVVCRTWISTFSATRVRGRAAGIAHPAIRLPLLVHKEEEHTILCRLRCRSGLCALVPPHTRGKTVPPAVRDRVPDLTDFLYCEG